MATIRAYTTIEQSRKLAQILPLESADMYYSKYDTIYAETLYGTCDIQYFNIHEYTPCWSLAALLVLLPKRIEIVDNVYELSVYLYGIYYWNIINGNLCFESKDKDNLVDACVDMIEKIHELNLL